MSMRSKLQALPVSKQLPSTCVAEMRTWLPEFCQQQTDAYIAWPGRTYPRRLGKPMAIWSLGGAAAPAQSELLSAGAAWGLSHVTSLSQLERVKLPLVHAPLSSWVLLGAACVLVGTHGAPKFEDATEPEAHPTPEQAASSHFDAQEPEHGADLRANLPATDAQQWVDVAVGWLSQVSAHGLLGLAQMALEAEGTRREQQGQSRLAWGCHAGANLLLFALEPARLVLQVVYLGLELGLALPFAAAGALVGLGVFASSMHVDPWAEVQDGIAIA